MALFNVQNCYYVDTCSFYFTLVNLKLDLDYRPTLLIEDQYQPEPVV